MRLGARGHPVARNLQRPSDCRSREGFRIHDSPVSEPPVACALLVGKEIHAVLAPLLPRRPHPPNRATPG